MDLKKLEKQILDNNESIDFEQALSTIYGVDLMEDNVEEARTRLLCGREDLRHIVNKNIVDLKKLSTFHKVLAIDPTIMFHFHPKPLS